jgi:hypothetical protein
MQLGQKRLQSSSALWDVVISLSQNEHSWRSGAAKIGAYVASSGNRGDGERGKTPIRGSQSKETRNPIRIPM